MDSEAVERVLSAFFADVRHIFSAALAQVRSAGGGGDSVGLPQTGAMKWGIPVC
jgi:hypothetical protein